MLEIGPGTGNLTEALAARAGRVYAVEIDPDLAAQLSGRFSNVQVINGDALKVELPHYNKIVSNLPYQISSKITYRLLSRPFETAVLMYQWEFARRMTRSPRQRGVRPSGHGSGLLLPDRDFREGLQDGLSTCAAG